jgi:hypothetical protein
LVTPTRIGDGGSQHLAARPAICLNMIVQNEAHIIQETLDAVAPYISSWVHRAPEAGRYVLTAEIASGPAMFDTTRLDRAGGIESTDPDPIAQLGQRADTAGLAPPASTRCSASPERASAPKLSETVMRFR